MEWGFVSDELYSNYVDREPHPRSARFIRNWHQKHLRSAVAVSGTPRRLLEIGPGHGYLAEASVGAGIEYVYVDTSPAVHRKMGELGYSGHLGLLHQVDKSITNFDMIWMSHVLEHSPTWIDARGLIEEAHSRLARGGTLVVISPDVLSWRREFWNVDWSHGYPTSLRNVIQLFDDVGLTNIVGRHHRNASFGLLQRSLFTLLTLIPHVAVDRLLTPSRSRNGDGLLYSWKAVFGWRQVFVSGRRK